MMPLTRNNDQLRRNEVGRGHELRPGVTGSTDGFNPNRPAFVDLLGEVKEGMLNSFALDQGRALVPLFHDR